MSETEAQYEARAKAVLERIINEKGTMDVGEMLHQLAGIGWDAAILYDDNGHWGMHDTGFASISDTPEDWEGTYFVAKGSWKDTPREAVVYAVERKLREDARPSLTGEV